MKRGKIALILLAGLSLVGTAYAPVRADHGGNNRGGDHRGGNKQNEVRLRADLTGDPIDGVTPEGKAEFRSRKNQMQFKVEVEEINLDDDTVLGVLVNGNAVGMITLQDGEGELELNSKDGDAVPAVQKGDVVTIVAADGTLIESGTF